MTIIEPICFSCKHFNLEKINCDAFKDQIPEEILNGDNDHSSPLPDQDNDIVFEPKNPIKENQ
jgi:hypothetical protein